MGSRLIDRGRARGGTVSVRRVACYALVCCSTGLLAPARAELIENGSFELGQDPGAFTELPAGSNNITGWTVTGEAIDYIGTEWEASDGLRSVDLDGSSGSPPHPTGGIAQTFATASGIAYLVTFDMAGNPVDDPTIKPMRVEAAGQSADFFFDTTGRSNADMGWLSKSWTFTATAAQTTLEFRSLTQEPETGYGPAVDNISVTVVPEPATMFACACAAPLVLARRRRRER